MPICDLPGAMCHGHRSPERLPSLRSLAGKVECLPVPAASAGMDVRVFVAGERLMACEVRTNVASLSLTCWKHLG